LAFTMQEGEKGFKTGSGSELSLQKTEEAERRTTAPILIEYIFFLSGRDSGVKKKFEVGRGRWGVSREIVRGEKSTEMRFSTSQPSMNKGAAR